MNILTQGHNKNNQERCLPVSKNMCQIARSGPGTWVQALGLLTLLLGSLCLVPSAIAHPGFDPEIEKITKKLAEDPDNVDLLVRRGQVYRSNGKFTESLQDLERAWVLDRQNRTVILQRAMTLSALGRDKEAEDALDSFLQDESHPQRVFGLAERAHIRARTGRTEPAIRDLTATLQLHPTVDLYLLRGQLQESLGNIEAAEEGYQDGLATLGEAIVLKKALIRVQLAQDRHSEALALVDEELERAHVKTSWYLKRAEILSLMGRAGAVRQAREHALSEANRTLAKRRTAMQLLARAEVYRAMGRTEDAERDLNMAAQRAPRFAQKHDRLKGRGPGPR
jgi:tetratricopeptide (TPR) repeat protein